MLTCHLFSVKLEISKEQEDFLVLKFRHFADNMHIVRYVTLSL